MNLDRQGSRLAPRDPWTVVDEARAERILVARNRIAAALPRRRWRSRHAPASPWGPPTGVVAARAMLPLAAGYFLSYLLRNVNGTLASDMAADLGTGADALGQLTSAADGPARASGGARLVRVAAPAGCRASRAMNGAALPIGGGRVTI